LIREHLGSDKRRAEEQLHPPEGKLIDPADAAKFPSFARSPDVPTAEILLAILTGSKAEQVKAVLWGPTIKARLLEEFETQREITEFSDSVALGYFVPILLGAILQLDSEGILDMLEANAEEFEEAGYPELDPTNPELQRLAGLASDIVNLLTANHPDLMAYLTLQLDLYSSGPRIVTGRLGPDSTPGLRVSQLPAALRNVSKSQGATLPSGQPLTQEQQDESNKGVDAVLEEFRDAIPDEFKTETGFVEGFRDVVGFYIALAANIGLIEDGGPGGIRDLSMYNALYGSRVADQLAAVLDEAALSTEPFQKLMGLLAPLTVKFQDAAPNYYRLLRTLQATGTSSGSQIAACLLGLRIPKGYTEEDYQKALEQINTMSSGVDLGPELNKLRGPAFVLRAIGRFSAAEIVTWFGVEENRQALDVHYGITYDPADSSTVTALNDIALEAIDQESALTTLIGSDAYEDSIAYWQQCYISTGPSEQP